MFPFLWKPKLNFLLAMFFVINFIWSFNNFYPHYLKSIVQWDVVPNDVFLQKEFNNALTITADKRDKRTIAAEYIKL